MWLPPKGPDTLSKGARAVREKWEEYAECRQKESWQRKNIHMGFWLQTENPGDRIPSLFLNATPSHLWPKASHHWGLNWSASHGSWVWPHLISSRKVRLNLYFHTDSVNRNNSCVEAGFEWLAQPIWMLLFSNKNVFNSLETTFADPGITSRICQGQLFEYADLKGQLCPRFTSQV